jgi:hypothetical protein
LELKPEVGGEGAMPKAPPPRTTKGILELNDVGRRRAFGALDNLKDNLGAFFQGFEPLGLDSAMMNKEITAVFLGDETITLCIVKPFYCSF